MTHTRRVSGFLAATSSIAMIAATQGSALGAVLTDRSVESRVTGQRLTPTHGELNPYEGNVEAFWRSRPWAGNIDAWAGNIDAWAGNIDAWAGNIDAWAGNIDAWRGDIDAFRGNVDVLYNNIDAWAGNIDAFAGNIDAWHTDRIDALERTGDLLDRLLDDTARRFGRTYRNSAGTRIEDAVFAPLLEKYGIDPEDPVSLAQWSAGDRAAFLVELHDQVGLHLGRDMADHWMGQIGWSPAVTQSVNMGRGVHVGVLDMAFDDGRLTGGRLTTSGYRIDGQAHGAAVLGLIAGAHDGYGVMGIVPQAEVSLYNPFDETGTASWRDVRRGVNTLGRAGVSVMNLSLGVAGGVLDQDWADEVFSKGWILNNTRDTVFVKAAGNAGISQNTDIDWTRVSREGDRRGVDAVLDRLLIVGSVGPDGRISSFSNSPGTGCLTVAGACGVGHRLMDRYLVAPGEMILVSDGDGGVTRASGTSFAAPLVAGTIALVQDEWSWLKRHPVETADIILESARDLGAPGTDAVYGRGMLDVAGALSPLDNQDLYINSWFGKSRLLSESGVDWRTHLIFGGRPTVTAFEDIGETYRDFDVSFEDLVLQERAEDAAALAWAGLGDLLSAASGDDDGDEDADDDADDDGDDDGDDFAARRFDGGTVSFSGADGRGWLASMHAGPNVRSLRGMSRMVRTQTDRTGLPSRSVSFTDQETGTRLEAGFGYGVLSAFGREGFARTTDYDVETGGVNPFASLSAGGRFASARFPVGDGLAVRFDFSGVRDERLRADPQTGQLRAMIEGLAPYEASSVTAGLEGSFVGTPFRLDVTRLSEETGFLGAQGSGALSLGGGSETTAITASASRDLPLGLSLAGSYSVGRAETTGAREGIVSLADDGAQAAAWQVAVSKDGVFGRRDDLRFSLARPLHVTAGTLEIEQTRVIDRVTGERGLVTDSFTIGGAPAAYVAETTYAAPILSGTSKVALFGQVKTGALARDDEPEATMGVRFSAGF